MLYPPEDVVFGPYDVYRFFLEWQLAGAQVIIGDTQRGKSASEFSREFLCCHMIDSQGGNRLF